MSIPFDARPSSSPLSDSSAAHRIPNEILDEILLQMCSLYDDAVDRAPLRHACLVSRRWADIARPEVWHSVVIVSAAHLRNLCILLDAPSARFLVPLSHMMQFLVCAVDFADRSRPPWLHLVHTQLTPRIRHPIHTSLDVVHEGVLDNLRTIHPSLPRALPSCFAPIQTLWLNNADFKTRATMLHLLNSLEHLDSLVCRKLTWKSADLPPPSLVLRKPLRSVWVDDSSDAPTDEEAGMHVWWLLRAAFGSSFRHDGRMVRSREATPTLHLIKPSFLINAN